MNLTTDRKFCRFIKGLHARPLDMTEPPEDGLCISAFIIMREKNKVGRVLMGKLNPQAEWDHIGALDRDRVMRYS